ncbi:hypothetical protein HOP50_10g58780 [Chloropicon primus]|uniref:EF-hand domain-containing protein n=1 Tax=Chloropicon primus TaxID=1764295 RepID=A0A5B8MVA5_9CHLO|nr:hypothetical protein A3770_10p58580 [Chloropicon primus]UPR02552.1 hypothetical protein HOP50_10g58780 [Chloropicon primus]|eukprot:QDZ23340.1 hypothetical protein A3770_10p58580 [Chloropicon primus]
MSSRYQKPYTIPEAFPPLLKELTREILREQPENIYEFGAAYFKNLLDIQTEEQKAQQTSLLDMGPEEMESFITEIFLSADKDGNGYLDRKEFQDVLRSTDLNLSKRDYRKIMIECDENDDGCIEYNEFVPFMVQVLQAFKAKDELENEMKKEQADAAEMAEAILIKGMYQEDFLEQLGKSFLAADQDKNGYLDRKEFKHCLRYAGLGLTKREVNLLMAEADTDMDGKISWQEFATKCYEIMVWHFTNEILEDQRKFPANELEKDLLLMFEAADTDQIGLLHQSDIKTFLKEYSYELLGLTDLQISVVFSESQPDKGGLVDYAMFSRKAAQLIFTFIDYESQYKRTKAVVNVSKASGSQLMRGVDKDKVLDLLTAVFLEADEDNTGTLDRNECFEALMTLGTGELQLRPKEIHALLSAMDEDENGMVTYSEYVEFMYDVLCHLEREEYIQDVAFEKAVTEAPEAVEEPVEEAPATEE